MTSLPTAHTISNHSSSSAITSTEDCASGSCLASSCLATLEQTSVRPTRQRCTIVRYIFSQSPHHFSAEQLHDKIKQQNHKISLATVYNTLALLTSHGLLRSIVIGRGSTVFDSNPTQHHHLFNIDTQELSDISPIAIGVLPSLPRDVALDSVDVVVRVRSKNNQKKALHEKTRGQK